MQEETQIITTGNPYPDNQAGGHAPTSLPAELDSIDCKSGKLILEMVYGVVHGTQVRSVGITSGSGSSFSLAGWGLGSTSISTEVKTIREFWLTPNSGGRDIHFNEVAENFGVADGHTVAFLLARSKDITSVPLAIVNVSSGDAVRMPEGKIKELSVRLRTSFLKVSSLAYLMAVPVFGIPALFWVLFNWMVALGAFVILFWLMNTMMKNSPALMQAGTSLQESQHLEAKITKGILEAQTWIGEAMCVRWV